MTNDNRRNSAKLSHKLSSLKVKKSSLIDIKTSGLQSTTKNNINFNPSSKNSTKLNSSKNTSLSIQRIIPAAELIRQDIQLEMDDIEKSLTLLTKSYSTHSNNIKNKSQNVSNNLSNNITRKALNNVRNQRDDKLKIHTLYWPMTFGEEAILNPDLGRHPTTVQSVSDCEILLLHQAQLKLFRYCQPQCHGRNDKINVSQNNGVKIKSSTNIYNSVSSQFNNNDPSTTEEIYSETSNTQFIDDDINIYKMFVDKVRSHAVPLPDDEYIHKKATANQDWKQYKERKFFNILKLKIK
jgi:hypothetical protein